MTALLPRLLVIAAWLLATLAPAAVHAVTAVHPFGVNVRASGPTSVFLTFQGLDAGETPVEAFWCGELQGALMAANPQLQLPVPVQSTNPCVPGTVYGRLPQPLDRSRGSTSGGAANLTDIMTIPASVARRAFQDAQAGLNSAFFYVRRFSGPAGDRFVVVTCRMSGGGARVPLALTEVRIAFDLPGTPPPVLVLARAQAPPAAAARIRYNGSGTLRGRWEVVRPGDPEPAEEDLITEATLPPEQRARQRRWQLLARFDRFLPPNGEFVLNAPDPALWPVDADGGYKLLLRIEASDDREAGSDTGGGRLAVAGGVAGFAMPVLRYQVSGAGAATSGGIVALAPAEGAEVDAAALRFEWSERGDAPLLRVEVLAGAAGAEREVLSALVRPRIGHYTAPRWLLRQQVGQPLRWRVVMLDADGRVRAASAWRTLVVR
jgi:hypothetical protein